MTKLNKAIKLHAKIADLEKKQAELLTRLGHSLQIQSIWSDAFKSGPCRFGGMQAYTRGNGRLKSELAFTNAYLLSSDGTKYYLTRQELAQLKPDAIIHPDYEETTK